MKIVENTLLALSGDHVTKEKRYLRKIIGFTSLGNGGATTVALGVAHSLAKQGFTVLYIDTRILFPTAHLYLVSKKDYLNHSGDLLDLNEKSYKDIIMKTRIPNLWLATAKNRGVIDIASPRENANAMRDFINKVKYVYDFVIIDISNELTNINSVSISESDIIYQVWDENVTFFANFKNFIAYLVSVGAEPSKIINIILNKRSGRINLPNIFSEKGLKLVSVLPGSYNVKSLCWDGKTICELSSTDKIDIEFVNNFKLILDDMFDYLGKSTEGRVEDINSVSSNEFGDDDKQRKSVKKEKKIIFKRKKGVQDDAGSENNP